MAYLSKGLTPVAEFKVGDKVKLSIENGERPVYGWGKVSNGEIGEITNVDGTNLTVKFPSQARWSGKVSEFTLAPAPRLTVGDYVKVLEGNGTAQPGDIAKIVTDDESPVPYRLQAIDGSPLGWKIAAEVVRATESEVAKAKCKFVVGDYVKVIGGSDHHIGKVAKVTEIRKGSESVALETINANEHRLTGSPVIYLRKATNSEVAAAKAPVVKSTEFKVGDKARQLTLSKYGNGKIGDIVTVNIVDYEGQDGLLYVIARSDESSNMMFLPDQLEKVVDADVQDDSIERMQRQINEMYGKLTDLIQDFETLKERFEPAKTCDPSMFEPMEALQELTPATDQDIRDAAIEQAKKDVAILSTTPRANAVFNLKGEKESFYPKGHGSTDKVEFVVDREKRTVVALLKYIGNNRAWAKGISKCDPDDVFNVHLGKAIALRRAFGLNVPDEYLKAPEPTEVRVGDVVYVSSTFPRMTVTSDTTSTDNKLVRLGMLPALSGHKVVDDSRVDA